MTPSPGQCAREKRAREQLEHEERARATPAVYLLSQLMGRMTRQGNQLSFNRLAHPANAAALRVHHDEWISILDADEVPDPLLDVLLAAVESDPQDVASVLALEDYLQDRPPSPRRMSAVPNWLRLVWLRRVGPGEILRYGTRRTDSESIRQEMHATLYRRTRCGLDHWGQVHIAGRNAYSSDPYDGHETVRRQAAVIRDVLGIPAVGLPKGAWYFGTSRLLMFKPNVMPAPRKNP